ncbi:MAG: RagB/SusD family nutrient uptake outer membrane protein [Bacteroidales bacterium]|nr:RagB/SusD family nutrient uptake outer membrane protein [Bacteroidales bacterium]
MKLYRISFALLLGLGVMTSCDDKLDLINPNQQTTSTWGNTAADLEEAVVAAYNHIRMEGTFARVGYTIDVCRGDEVWNSSQVWYMPFDDLNEPITDEIGQWSWRDWYYTITVCNYVLSRCGEDDNALNDQYKRIKGQVLFLRGLAYYTLVNYYQNPALITDFGAYSTLDGLYASNVQEGDENGFAQYDRVVDQIEADFSQAMTLLPSRDTGGEWAKGRATCGAAAGYYARTLMQRHKYSEALAVLKDIIGKRYGSYRLVANYGDNFREGPAYENNEESLFEVQFLDHDSQGTDDEWTPVNTSANATQGSAIESNYGPGDFGGWADLSASPWLYNLFKAERTTSGSLDPRLYWTIGTYENDWEGFEYGNVCFTVPMSADAYIVTNNNYGGLPIAKWTNLRTGLYDKVVTGLHDGINLRMMRYADVLLRAAECENEVNGPTQQAIDWINEVRARAGLVGLNLANFNSKDKLFEQIANVERPKEFGCEYGRGLDLIRWGFFYDSNRLAQLKQHAAVNFWTRSDFESGVIQYTPKDYVSYDGCSKSSYDTFVDGHEYLPIYQGTLNDNPNLVGNSANNSTSNASYFSSKGWTVHPVVDL